MNLSSFILLLSTICNSGKYWHYIDSVYPDNLSVIVYFKDSFSCSRVNSLLVKLPFVAATNIGKDDNGEWLQIFLEDYVVWS